MDKVFEIEAKLQNGQIITALDLDEISERVMERKQIVVLKNVFEDDQVSALKNSVREWGKSIAPAAIDDFRGNYHRQRAMVSRLQQAPHVFHDYNFNSVASLPADMQAQLLGLFDPLRQLYNALTGNETKFEIPEKGPYVHPQIIHYPSGGGFFGRHWHNLMPQKLGFIVSLSKQGRDYRNGGTRFEIDGDIVDMEGRHQIGDICVWRYDHDHWVTQSDLQDKFDWDSDSGRWVATYAYFDPAA